MGDNRSISVDLRFITATNKDLPKLISRGSFQEDLFYRVNVIPIHLPPLREKKDIPPLVVFFLQRLNRDREGKIKGLNPEANRLFMRYSWPGNVRELKSTLEFAFVLAGSGVIEPKHLPAALSRSQEDCSESSREGMQTC